VKTVIETIQTVAGTTLPVVSDAIDRPHEIPDTRADITRAENVLGWIPRWSFEDGIRQMIKGDRS
jgi:nucleoside-diphosphate-sugar epimerase